MAISLNKIKYYLNNIKDDSPPLSDMPFNVREFNYLVLNNSLLL